MIRTGLVSALLAITVAGTSAVALAVGPADAATGPASSIPGCKVGVWADDFTDAGQLAWQRGLPVPTSYDEGDSLTPVVVGGVSVFADGNALYGLRESDGHRAWHHTFPNTSNTLTAGSTGIISSLTAWKGLVIVLLGTSSDDPSLVALNAATGAVRWRVPFKGQELEIFAPVITSDGVAAILNHDDTVQTFDLASGRHLWSRTYRKDTVVQAEGRLLVIDSKSTDESPSTLRGVVARTGHTVWARSGFPNFLENEPGPDGVILGYGFGIGLGTGEKIYPVLAVSAATGKTVWQLRPNAPVIGGLWGAPAGVLVAAGFAGSAAKPAGTLYLLNPKTGKIRWSAAGTNADQYTDAVITAANVTYAAGTVDTGSVVDRNAATGAVRWTVAITSTTPYRYLEQPAGPDVIAVFPGKSDSAHSRLLAIDVATGKVKATDLLPDTATVDAAPAVTGSHVLLEPESVSCATPVHP